MFTPAGSRLAGEMQAGKRAAVTQGDGLADGGESSSREFPYRRTVGAGRGPRLGRSTRTGEGGSIYEDAAQRKPTVEKQFAVFCASVLSRTPSQPEVWLVNLCRLGLLSLETYSEAVYRKGRAQSVWGSPCECGQSRTRNADVHEFWTSLHRSLRATIRQSTVFAGRINNARMMSSEMLC